MSSPKLHPSSRTGWKQTAAMDWGRFCYRLLYAMSFLAAIYAVLAHFRSAPPVSGSNIVEEAPPGLESLVNDVPVVLSPISRAEQDQRRWIEKPNSLCFGLGNVTILTVAIDLPGAYLMQLRRNRLSYASNHGYRYCEVSTTLDPSRPSAWTKLKAMSLLLSFTDIVVAMEADAIIRNKSVRIESILELEDYNVAGKDVIYTNDYQQDRESEANAKSYINTGVYIMHNTPWTKRFLESLYNFHISSMFQKNRERDAVMLYRMKNIDDFNAHVAVIPYRYMNSPLTHELDKYEDGDFVAHYAEVHSLDKYRELSSRLGDIDL
ncbi:hypothetical protein M758_5G121400 [Ceratodon purpureus]|uniref:Nucleotide-diphospho-sugar transferase domain-containing protein n=1 Tax=Ceratodon purpureus TaxID=3225 RepID=A0A8T0I2F2_CERPU|nr:hypothetical protein KC19_5G104800 [Ceratodon purpureus]KAG0616512.1 hypothetical protein M758_5G121400 [Ceratodon purpureus]